MPSILDRLRATLRRAQASPVDLTAALDDARGAEADAIAAVEAQAAAVAHGFAEPDSARAAARAKLADLRAAAEDVVAIRVEFERRLEAAVAAERDRTRQIAYADAKVKAGKASIALGERYPAIAAELLGLLRGLEVAKQDVARINADLPEGAEPLPDPEMIVRAVPGLSSIPDEEEEVERWACEDGTPVADAYLGNVVDYGNGSGSYKTNRREGYDDVEVGQKVTLRTFKKVTSYETTIGIFPPPLVHSLHLPSLYGNEAIMGQPGPSHFWVAPDDLLSRAETALGAMQKPAPIGKAERAKRVEFRMVLTDDEVEHANAPASDYHDRAVRSPRVGFSTSPFNLPARAGGRR